MQILGRLLLFNIVFVTSVYNVSLDFRIRNDEVDKKRVLKLKEGDLIEEDIILRPNQINDENRNLVRDPYSLWPHKTLYFRFEPNEFGYLQKLLIKEALNDIMSESCVKFIERTTQPTFINIRNPGPGCAGVVGYHQYGGLDLFLGGPGCQTRGTIQHEFLHALGFWHEHTRHDRDNYIKVLWNNIKPGREVNFYKRSPSEVLPIKMPYDYGSVMHYRSNSFSRDYVSPTIIPLFQDVAHKLGQRRRFSKVDIAKLNRLYNCPTAFYKGDDITNHSSIYGDIKDIPETIEVEPEKINYSTSTADPTIEPENFNNSTSRTDPTIEPEKVSNSSSPTDPTIEPQKVNNSSSPTDPTTEPDMVNNSTIPTDPPIEPEKVNKSSPTDPTTEPDMVNNSTIPTDPTIEPEKVNNSSSPTDPTTEPDMVNNSTSPTDPKIELETHGEIKQDVN